MSWDHFTTGHQLFIQRVMGLEDAGVKTCIEKTGEKLDEQDLLRSVHELRRAWWIDEDGKRQYIEEYLAVEDLDCDGISQIGVFRYEEDNREKKKPKTQVLDPL